MKTLKIVLLVLCLLLTAAAPLSASGTRVQSLGYLANYYVIDSYNIWLFPSTLVNYDNNVFMESYTGNPLAGGGVNLPITSQISLGLYLTDDTRTIAYTDPQLAGYVATQKMDILVGYRAGVFNYGVHLASYTNKGEYSDPVNDVSQNGHLSSTSIEAGVSYKADSRNQLDASFSYTGRDFQYEDTSRDTAIYREPSGHRTISFTARYLYSMTDKVVLVPFFNYTNSGMGYDNAVKQNSFTGGIASLTQKQNSLTVGAGFDIVPREKVLVTCATGMMRSSSTTDVTLITGTAGVQPESGTTILPFVNIGMEAELYHWLGFRMSMYKLIEKMTMKSAVSADELDEYNEYFNNYVANLGLYFRLRNLKIDVALDTNSGADFLHNGPFIISGKDYSTSGNLFKRVSLIYSF